MRKFNIKNHLKFEMTFEMTETQSRFELSPNNDCLSNVPFVEQWCSFDNKNNNNNNDDTLKWIEKTMVDISISK
jgi:hypothetical protein